VSPRDGHPLHRDQSGAIPADIELAGWLENLILAESTSPAEATRLNQLLSEGPAQGEVRFRTPISLKKGQSLVVVLS
jgi:hypothetical protein